jgi:hypothetical membrane protein
LSSWRQLYGPTRENGDVRVQRVGGILGPTAFVTAWVLGSVLADDYSAVDDAISRLAAVGAETRWLMTAGFVAFGIGVPLFAPLLPRPAAISATVAGFATLGVAATPLDWSDAVDTLHGVFAATGYVALALTPILGASLLPGPWSRVSVTIGVIAGACLALTAFSDANGLFQRIGLTLCDAWIVTVALRTQPP